MKARLRVYRQLIRQCRLILVGKDLEEALVAADEAKQYMKRIAELEKGCAQPELFDVPREDEHGSLEIRED